jgi:hypothetical protein
VHLVDLVPREADALELLLHRVLVGGLVDGDEVAAVEIDVQVAEGRVLGLGHQRPVGGDLLRGQAR